MSQINNAEAVRSNANVVVSDVLNSEKLFPQETVDNDQPSKPEHWNDYSDLVKAAEHQAGLWDKEIEVVFSGRGETQIKAVSAIYNVCWAFRDNDAVLKSFLKDRGEAINGNVQNWVQPVVRAFLKTLHESSRSQITKIAGAIRLGIDNTIPPEQYSTFLSDNGGYCSAYQKYLDAQPKNGDQEAVEKMEVMTEINDYLSNQTSPEIEAPEELLGCVGRQVVVIKMTEEGHYRILKRLEFDEKQLQQLLVRHAARQSQATRKAGI